MKPQQSDVEYCIEHKDFVNGLLEKRGGWQQGDWFIRSATQCHPRVVEGMNHADVMNMLSVAGEIWLPSVDDVLAMLEERGYSDLRTLITTHWPGRPLTECYLVIADPLAECKPRAYGITRLIAHLELSRAVEGK